MLASREPELFNGNMQPQSPSASQARNRTAPQTPSADWRATSGIIDRMLAYRDWWNIPEGRGRPATGRNRARPVALPDREAAA
jgi:hypothetical protein